MVERKVKYSPEPSKTIIRDQDNALRLITDDLERSRGLYIMRALSTSMGKAGAENALHIEAIGYFSAGVLSELRQHPAICGISVFKLTPDQDILRTKRSRYPELRVVLDYDIEPPLETEEITAGKLKGYVLRAGFVGPIEINQYSYIDGKIDQTEPIQVERLEWEKNPEAISNALYQIFTNHPPVRKPATE